MRNPTIRIAIAVAAIVAGLAACGPVTPRQREDTLRVALNANSLQAAQEQLVAGSRTQWRQDSELLVKAHGAMRLASASGGTAGFPPGFATHYAIFRIAYADGYERCLWVEGRGGGALTLVNGGYVDCGTIPAPSVVYGTPHIPGTPPATPTPLVVDFAKACRVRRRPARCQHRWGGVAAGPVARRGGPRGRRG